MKPQEVPTTSLRAKGISRRGRLRAHEKADKHLRGGQKSRIMSGRGKEANPSEQEGICRISNSSYLWKKTLISTQGPLPGKIGEKKKSK